MDGLVVAMGVTPVAFQGYQEVAEIRSGTFTLLVTTLGGGAARRVGVAHGHEALTTIDMISVATSNILDTAFQSAASRINASHAP